MTITLWDTTAGKCIDTFRHHTNEVYSLAVSSNNKFIASCGYDKAVRILPIDLVDVDELFGDIKHAAS